MTAREYLEQVETLDTVVNMKSEELRSLYEMAQRVTVAYSDMPGCPNRNISGMENVLAKIADAEDELNDEIDRLIDRKREVSRVLDRVSDVQHRAVLFRRYVLLNDWKTVANSMGMDIRSVYRYHKYGLEEVQSILDKIF